MTSPGASSTPDVPSPLHSFPQTEEHVLLSSSYKHYNINLLFGGFLLAFPNGIH
jgi:hypothetical protein